MRGDIKIDSRLVITEFINPVQYPNLDLGIDKNWYAKHVRESQNLLQVSIMKFLFCYTFLQISFCICQNSECCLPARSDIFLVLKKQFLPPPCSLRDDFTGRPVAIVSSNIDKEQKFNTCHYCNVIHSVFQNTSSVVKKKRTFHMVFIA